MYKSRDAAVCRLWASCDRCLLPPADAALQAHPGGRVRLRRRRLGGHLGRRQGPHPPPAGEGPVRPLHRRAGAAAPLGDDGVAQDAARHAPHPAQVSRRRRQRRAHPILLHRSTDQCWERGSGVVHYGVIYAGFWDDLE